MTAISHYLLVLSREPLQLELHPVNTSSLVHVLLKPYMRDFGIHLGNHVVKSLHVPP